MAAPLFDGEEEFIQSALDALEREDFQILLEAAQTGALSGSPGMQEVARRFWTQWLEGEGLLTCPYCNTTFPSLDELTEHDKYEC